MAANVISDDLLEHAYIAAYPPPNDGGAPLHDAVRFTFKPALSEERVGYLDGSRDKSDAENHRRAIGILVRKIKSWDMTRGDGGKTPLNSDTVRRLKPRLFDRVLNIVLGYEAGDIDDQPPVTEQDVFERELDAASGGMSLPVV